MRRVRFKSTLFDGTAYTILGGGSLALGLAENHGLARWEWVGLSLLLFVAAVGQFVGVWRRRTR